MLTDGMLPPEYLDELAAFLSKPRAHRASDGAPGRYRTEETPLAEITAGLSEAELEAAENLVGTRFPGDLRSLLRAFLPLGESFPNWRDHSDEQLVWQLGKVDRATRFDVEHDAFWSNDWGPKPGDNSVAVEIALSLSG